MEAWLGVFSSSVNELQLVDVNTTLPLPLPLPGQRLESIHCLRDLESLPRPARQHATLLDVLGAWSLGPLVCALPPSLDCHVHSANRCWREAAPSTINTGGTSEQLRRGGDG
jgi:hypothetical protein